MPPVIWLSASRQFTNVKTEIVRKIRITTDEKIRKVVEEAKNRQAVILFTMVSQKMRRALLEEAQKQNVVAMDVMGPVLEMLSHYFHDLPSDEPGLQYKVTMDYYKRIEAMEFTVRHDEGLGLDTIDHADIVLLGISRTSKTPLSVYLAYHGYRCANVPIVMGQPIPEKIYGLDKKKLIGLVISREQLVSRRVNRLQAMGRPQNEDYAQESNVDNELQYAQDIFKKLGDIRTVDVTGRAMEEIAIEVMSGLGVATNA